MSPPLDSADLSALIDSFASQSILVVGDIMLDRFLWGSVSRISPEAPVPVVEVREESAYPGGAANVARNLRPFGADTHLIGLLGDDANGAALIEVLNGCGIGIEQLVQLPDFTTITKTRVIARQQQVVRVDRERRQPLLPDQEKLVLDRVATLLPKLKGIIIEDYGKGLMTASLAEGIVREATGAGVLVTVDPNPNNPINWRGVSAVKPNRAEAFKEAGLIDDAEPVSPLEDSRLREVGHRLLEKWDTEHVLITLGEHGMVLFSRENGDGIYHIPTKAKEVFDVSGAGDTAIAVFTLALCAGAGPKVAADLSNLASGVVVGKLGTAVVTRQELLKSLTSAEPD